MYGSSWRLRRAGWGWLAVLLVAGLLAGCGRPVAAPQEPPPPASATYPLTIQDDAGRQVTVAKRPERIVSLSPSNTEILFAIGAGSRVVGVDNFSDHPPEVRSLPRVGGLVDTNYERIVELRPDLVFTIGGTEQQVRRLEQLGIPVVVVQPRTLQDVFERIERIGQLVDEVEGARRVVAQMRQRVDAIRRAVATVPESERPRVFYEVWHDPLMTVGPGGFIHDVIVTAGGVNVFADAQQEWPQVNLEDVVRRDPQVIITPFKESYEQLVARRPPGWQGIAAVREGRVLLIDQNLISRPGPRIVEALEWIAHFLHPDRVPLRVRPLPAGEAWNRSPASSTRTG